MTTKQFSIFTPILHPTSERTPNGHLYHRVEMIERPVAAYSTESAMRQARKQGVIAPIVGPSSSED